MFSPTPMRHLLITNSTCYKLIGKNCVLTMVNIVTDTSKATTITVYTNNGTPIMVRTLAVNTTNTNRCTCMLTRTYVYLLFDLWKSTRVISIYCIFF